MRSVQNVQTNDVKGHGYIKKTKAYGAVGAIAFIGVLTMTGSHNAVLAQETDAEPVITNEASDTVIQAEVISTDLNQSIDQATQAGVEVTEGGSMTYPSLEEAQDDLKQQETAMQEALKAKEADNQKIAEIEAQNEQIKKDNEKSQSDADAENARREAEYNEKMTKYEADKAAYDQAVKDSEKAQAEYEAALNEMENLDHSGFSTTSGGIFPSGTWNHFVPVTYEDNVKVFGQGNVGSIADVINGNYQVVIYDPDKKIPESNIIESIVWEGGVPEAVDPAQQANITPWDQIQALYTAETGDTNLLYPTNEGGTTVICSVPVGVMVRFPNAVKMKDGSTKNLIAKFNYYGEVLPVSYGFITLWNGEGAINMYNGGSYSSGPADGVLREYFIEGPDGQYEGTGEKYLWSNMIYDTDLGQSVMGNYNMLALGGFNGFESGPTIYSLEDPNATVINPKWGYGVDASGPDSAPDSTASVVAYDTYMWLVTQNSPGGLGSGTAAADFGRVNVITKILTPPGTPTPPDKPTWEPTAPSYKPLIPVAPTPVAAQYHKVLIEQTPTNEKSVTDKAGNDINQNTVATNSEAHWLLGNRPLEAGRDFIKELSLTDVLPEDFDVDLGKTTFFSQNYDVTYDASTRTVTFVAKADAIDALNADLRSEVEIPLATIVGYPTKDAASYPNTFTTHYTTIDAIFDVNDPSKTPEKSEKENKIDIPSNEVIILTPDGPTPKKENYNESDVKIDGKLVNIGTTNVYKMLWDLDQYKGMEADEETIQKGFYYFDDFPEEAVTINAGDVKVIDADGNEIAIEVNEYDSKEAAPQEVQDIVNANGLSFEGAFQVIKVVDPAAFFEKYVKTGSNLTVISPMTVKEELKNKAKTYTNNSFQVDFGNAYATNTVENEVPVVDPVKKNLNSKGEDINGKVVAAGSVNHYNLKWDLDQYKGMEETAANIMKGFFYLDDYDENAVTPLNDQVSFIDEAGNAVSGITSAVYNAVSAVPQAIQDAIAKNGFDIKGALQVFTVEDPMSFYENYVKQGINIYITTPMQVKMDMVGKYLNGGFQIDFGNIGYQTNIVENEVVTPAPKKEDLNTKGVDINGKMVLPGSTNVYKLTWDLDQYKDIEADDEVIAKGFMFVDDYPEEALDLLTDAFKIVDSDGKNVSGVSVTAYKDIKDMNKTSADALIKAGVETKGAFVLFRAEDPQDFFNKYVLTGKNIIITAPMKVKEKFAGEYENTGFQIDFGNGKQADIVVNNVPKMEVVKDVVIEVNDGKSINNTTIQKGTVFNYQLTGALVPKDRSEELWDYSFIDDYQETHDEYNGVYKVFAKVDIKTSDGKTIQAGTDVTEYTTQEIDNAKGAVTIKFDEEFLRSIGLDSEFQAEAFLQMKRIAAGDVENSFINTVNEVEVVSNVVITHTPEDPVPGNPPVNTGVESGIGLWTSLAGVFCAVSIVLAAIKRRFR